MYINFDLPGLQPRVPAPSVSLFYLDRTIQIYIGALSESLAAPKKEIHLIGVRLCWEISWKSKPWVNILIVLPAEIEQLLEFQTIICIQMKVIWKV